MSGKLAPNDMAHTETHLDVCQPCLELVAILGKAGEDETEMSLDTEGRYLVVEEIGSGGMGKILSCHDTLLAREVAVKVIQSPHVDGLVHRLRREMAITAKLQHPAIVPIYDAGTTRQGEPFFVMRRLPGKTLAELADQSEGTDAQFQLLPAVTRAVEAVAFAHSQGILHRDLKPQNVMVGTHGESVVVDWGLAVELGASREDPPENQAPLQSEAPRLAKGSHALMLHDNAHTLPGQVIGTPGFMPPEQKKGQRVDERADVYGLGAVLYYLFAKRPPRLKVDGAVQCIREVRPDLAPELTAIVDRCLADSPNDRYQRVSELAADLHRLQSGQRVTAHQYQLRELIRRWLSRHRGIVLVTALAVVSVVVVSTMAIGRTIAARHQAVSAQERSEQQRVAAEGLVQYSLTELKSKLDALGQLDLLEGTASQIQAYYQEMPERPGEAGNADLGRKSRVFALLGQVALARGDLDAAAAHYQASMDSAAKMKAQREDSDTQETFCLATMQQSDIALQRKQFQRALTLQGTCLDIALAQDSSDARWAALAAQALLGKSLVYRQLGQAQKAEQSLELSKPHADRVAAARGGRSTRTRRMAMMVYDHLATHYMEVGKAQESAKLHELNLTYIEGLPHQDLDTEYTRDLSLSYFGVARGRYGINDFEGATQANQMAIQTSKALIEGEPRNLDWLAMHGKSLDFRGHIAYAQADMNGAFQAFQEGLVVAQTLPVLAPHIVEHTRDLAASELNLAMVYFQHDDLENASKHYYQCAEVFSRLRSDHPDSAAFQRDSLLVYRHLTQLELTLKNPEKAKEHAQQAFVFASKLHQANENTSTIVGLASAYLVLAYSGDHATYLRKAKETLHKVAHLAASNQEVAMALDELREAEQK